MNTIDATPQSSLGGRVTLVLKGYLLVNATIRKNMKRAKISANPIYGKQTLTDANADRAVAPIRGPHGRATVLMTCGGPARDKDAECGLSLVRLDSAR
jgi:hypothetical protein